MQMKHPEFKYIETAFGGLNKRNRVIEIHRIQLPPPREECYRTYFRFNDSYRMHWEQNGKSVAGFRGKSYADYLPLDIDNPDPANSLNTARVFLSWLECQYDLYVKAVGIFFSGSKGFHLEIPTSFFGEVQPSDDLPDQLRRMVSSFGNWNFDMNIYRANQLWRIENSRHPKSGLYKIRLTPTQLMSLTIDEITEMARAPLKTNGFPDYDDWCPVPELVQLWENTQVSPALTVDGRPLEVTGSLDFLKKGVDKGQRNNTAFYYAKKLKSMGFSQNSALELLSEWNSKNRPRPLPLYEIDRTAQSVYRFEASCSNSMVILEHLRNDPIYKALDALQRDIYIQILCRVNTVEKTWVHDGYYYDCAPGGMIFSYRTFAQRYCGAGVTDSTVRSTFERLKRLGRIKTESLGNRRGSRLKLIGWSPHTLIDTPTHTPTGGNGGA